MDHNNHVHDENCEHDHHHGEGCDCGHDHSEGCDCGHDHESDRISLTLEDGSSIECNVLGVFAVEDKEYIALLPDESEEVLIYSFQQDGENVNLSLIETDEEFEKVSQVFYSFFEDDEE